MEGTQTCILGTYLRRFIPWSTGSFTHGQTRLFLCYLQDAREIWNVPFQTFLTKIIAQSNGAMTTVYELTLAYSWCTECMYYVFLWCLYICLFVQVERTASEKAVSAALAEEREKHGKIVADMKVCYYVYLCIYMYIQSPILVSLCACLYMGVLYHTLRYLAVYC